MIACSALTNGACVKRIPLYFRCDRDDVEFATETVHIWPTGFLMRSQTRLVLGTLLLLRLHVPIEISGSPFREMRSKGRIVAEQRLDDGTMGYTVEIQQAEPRRKPTPGLLGIDT